MRSFIYSLITLVLLSSASARAEGSTGIPQNGDLSAIRLSQFLMSDTFQKCLSDLRQKTFQNLNGPTYPYVASCEVQISD